MNIDGAENVSSAMFLLGRNSLPLFSIQIWYYSITLLDTLSMAIAEWIRCRLTTKTVQIMS